MYRIKTDFYRSVAKSSQVFSAVRGGKFKELFRVVVYYIMKIPNYKKRGRSEKGYVAEYFLGLKFIPLKNLI